MAKALKIDFYKTEDLNGNSLDISHLITQVAALPFANRRVDLTDSFVFVHNVRPHGQHTLGEIVKAKMVDLPDKVNRNAGLPEDLGLNADEGIGHRTHFLYDRGAQVLLLQRDWDVRSTAFTQSIAHPINEAFNLSLIFKPNALRRLNEIREVRRLTFRMARPGNPEAVGNLDTSTTHAIGILSDLGGRQLDVSISVGRTRGGELDRAPALRFARTLFGRRAQEVEKIVVSGKDEAGASAVIDLIEDRLVYETRVDMAGRNLDPRQCERALLEAHRDHLEYLRHYRQPE
jgi:hypothetical protein